MTLLRGEKREKRKFNNNAAKRLHFGISGITFAIKTLPKSTSHLAILFANTF